MFVQICLSQYSEFSVCSDLSVSIFRIYSLFRFVCLNIQNLVFVQICLSQYSEFSVCSDLSVSILRFFTVHVCAVKHSKA